MNKGMPSFNEHKNFLYYGVILTSLVLFTLLSVNMLAPSYLNADVTINSVMSLQNLTLYYWGQNRLINLLPLMASIFQDPSWNLYFVLLFSCLVHFTLLLYISKIVSTVIHPNTGRWFKVNVFFVIAFIFSASLKDAAEFSVSIHHIEYTLPLLILLWVFFEALKEDGNFKFWFVYSGAGIFVATGLNPSVILIECFFLASLYLIRRQFPIRIRLLAIFSIMSFMIWQFIAKQTGEGSYSSFGIERLPHGIELVIANILSDLNLWIVTLIILILVLLKLYFKTIAKVDARNEYNSASSVSNLFTYLLVLFSLCWILLFSSNHWVEMNGYPSRYFTFLVYIAIIYITVQLINIFKLLPPVILPILGAVTCLAYIAVTVRPVVPLLDYQEFKKVAGYHSSSGLYSGNYWDTWSAVHRDMQQGETSYGLTFRGEGNQNKVQRFVDKKFKSHGGISVLCLHETINNCKNQVTAIIGPLFVKRSVELNDGINEIYFVRTLSSLKRKKQSIVSLTAINRRYTADEIRSLSLEFSKKIIHNGKWFIEIDVINSSELLFSSLSTIGNPIRLSWRFIDSAGEPVSDWDDARMDLPSDIGASEYIKVRLPIDSKLKAKLGALQVSIVQEGVFWAHDIGVKPLTIPWNSIEP
jgi:hypothetical protein